MAPKKKAKSAPASNRPRLKRDVERDILPEVRDLKDLKSDAVCGACLLNLEADAEVAFIDSCNHFFHYDCVECWSQKENSCPQCKKRFSWLAKYTPQGRRKSLERVKKRDQEGEEDEAFEEFQGCEICKEVGDERTLLLCDGMHGTCNSAYHYTCVGLTCVPRGSWFCPDCILRGFDVDARGCRGKRPMREVEPATSSSAAATSSAASSANPFIAPAAPSTSDSLLGPDRAEPATSAPAAAVLAEAQSGGSRRSASSTVPPQLRLNTLACVTPAIDVPAFQGARNAINGADSSGPAVEPQGLFASFAAKRRARRNSGSTGSSASATSFIQLNPAYEEDKAFMGKASQ